MSTTFYTELGETLSFVVACHCETNRQVVEGGTNAHYNEALALLVAMRTTMLPCDCYDTDVFITPVTEGQGPELNVTATNATHLLGAVYVPSGAPENVCGSIDGAELLARIGEANPYATTCPDYVIGRLPQLTKVAAHAARLGRQVVWA